MGLPSRELRPDIPFEDRDACRIFVGSLPYECGDAELRALVEQIQFKPTTQGTSLQECRVLPNKGCGYIKFATWEAAEEAMDTLQDRQVDGWKMPLRLKWAAPKGGSAGGGASPYNAAVNGGLLQSDSGPLDPSSTEQDIVQLGLNPHRLFVGSLDRSGGISEQSLQELFQAYGTVTDVKHFAGKGVAFVTFADFDQAKFAMMSLQNQNVPSISYCINIKFSTRR
eukprot:gnl/MRDRNA2_/MRDRNA2_18295_c0_seq1.p1 gnl/MRDRNA2_/MRDRNA2_18295_c0~~gnl/MRDRNA2_/MRDRNA2_18295_c0_seq1.p1  ORF type:complete len:250 (-),score=57.09 gnl/MRDRNA2_/MRDRNA2_18295_c0_seq1:92-766(-)